jgi:hypothetical protein
VPLAGRRPNIQRLPCQLGPPVDGGVPKDPFVREKFARERSAAKKLDAEYFHRFPKDVYRTEVESWRNLQSQNIEFTMKRLSASWTTTS